MDADDKQLLETCYRKLAEVHGDLSTFIGRDSRKGRGVVVHSGAEELAIVRAEALLASCMEELAFAGRGQGEG